MTIHSLQIDLVYNMTITWYKEIPDMIISSATSVQRHTTVPTEFVMEVFY